MGLTAPTNRGWPQPEFGVDGGHAGQGHGASSLPDLVFFLICDPGRTLLEAQLTPTADISSTGLEAGTTPLAQGPLSGKALLAPSFSLGNMEWGSLLYFSQNKT